MRTIKKVFNISVSVKEGAAKSVLRGIVQFDTLNEVNIRLSDGTKAFNYDGYTNIIFKVLKADGTAYIDSEGENVIATSPVDGVVTVNLAGQSTTAAGLCQSVLEIYSGDGKMTTARFNYEVFENLDLDETIESTSEYPILQKLVEDVSVLEASVEEAKAESLPVGVVTHVFYSANAEEEDARLLEIFGAMQNRTAAFVVSRHSVGFPPFGGGALFITIYRAGVGYGTMDVRCYSGDGVSLGVTAMRDIINGVLGDWEFANPPMVLGVEYRTTERHGGRPVYAKLIRAGELPATASNTIVIADDVRYVVSVDACDIAKGQIVPNTAWNGVVGNTVSLGGGKDGIVITTNFTTSSTSNVYITVKYTKTTDT